MKIPNQPKFTLTALALALAPLAVSQPMLEEVLVTATKREVGMQDVPIAISVMGAEQISEQGITSMEEMAVFMPNVHIAEGGAGDQLFIRGVGSGINYGFEQSVGTFIDGVYFGRGQASRSTFLDVSRVEVLKGPQSTLFGKNTIAGAINITTARPTDEFEGAVEGGYEPEFDRWYAQGMISGPISDNFSGRFVIKQEETEGYMSNTLTGEDERSEESTVARVVLDWVATDSLDFSLKYEHGEMESTGRQDMISIATDFSVGRYQAADPNFTAGFGYDKSAQNIMDTQFHDSEWDIFTLTGELMMGEHSLKSITGYVNYEFQNYLDSDYGPLEFLARGRDEQHKQFTQEFILSSPTGGNLEYLAGLYYQKEELEHDRNTDVILSAAGIGDGSLDASGPSTFQQDAETLSAFTMLTWHVSDSFRLIGGLRYSDDQKEFEKKGYVASLFETEPNNALGGIYDAVLNFSTDHQFDSNGAVRCTGVAYTCTVYPEFDNELDEQHWTGDITVQWDATDSMMAYFKVGNGYKAGGFDEANGRGSLEAAVYDDETVEGVELGAKVDLWDSRGRLNVAVFYNEFEDVQVSTFDGNAGFTVGNAAETETKGVEADFTVALTEELTLNAALAYLDASYKSFPDATCNEPQILDWIAGGGARSSCVQDLAGEPLQFAPEWSGNLGLNYLTQLSDNLELKIGADVMYSDDYVVPNDLDPVLNQESFYKINARIQIGSYDGTWSLALLGRNLTDEATTTWGNDVPLAGQGFSETYFQHIDAPRSYELQARYRF
jgi:iron complex outermembrane recepter protein